MGICNVLAIIPFLCSAPADQQPEEEQEQVIEAQPAPEVAVNTLTPPPAASRPLSEYQVLPPASSGEVAYASPQETAIPPGQGASSFSDWVNRNWGGDTEVAAAESVVPASVPEPRLDLSTSSPMSRPSSLDEMAQPMPELEVEPAPQPYEMSTPQPRLARLDPVSEPTQPDPTPTPARTSVTYDPDEALAERQSVETATSGPSTVEERQAAMATPRPQSPPQPRADRPSMPSAASMTTSWDPAAALRAGTISFAEPEPLVRPGARVEADGIAARKRRDVRDLEREFRRQARDQGR